MRSRYAAPMRVILAALLLALSGCTSTGNRIGPAPGAPGSADDSAPVRTARAFVAALNSLDADQAADLIDWERWVADDARLTALVSELRRRYLERPPGPLKAQSHPIDGSEVTLKELLAASDPGAMLARISRDRFAAAVREDFSRSARVMDAQLVSWNLDRIDTSATVFMPNGERVEMRMINRRGKWRLLPRWYP